MILILSEVLFSPPGPEILRSGLSIRRAKAPPYLARDDMPEDSNKFIFYIRYTSQTTNSRGDVLSTSLFTPHVPGSICSTHSDYHTPIFSPFHHPSCCNHVYALPLHGSARDPNENHQIGYDHFHSQLNPPGTPHHIARETLLPSRPFCPRSTGIFPSLHYIIYGRL